MTAGGNVGVAMALVVGAGLSTTVGACAAFFAKLAAPRTLALGLALSAGVMMYVSFVEIFMSKGVVALADGGWSEDNAYRYGTLLFFAGMFVTFVLDVIVHYVSNRAGMNQEHDPHSLSELASNRANNLSCKGLSDKNVPTADTSKGDDAPTVPAVPDVEAGTSDTASEASSPTAVGACACVPNKTEDGLDLDASVHLAHKPEEIPEDVNKVVNEYVTNDHHKFGLQKMGLMTALAIGIHNLPEGLATFAAALADPVNGVAIAVAIALHNIPEGVCVAMPVYYATGSRWKGFLWAFLSGLSEPVGGLLGWLVLYGNRMSDIAYGCLFCTVAGMMVYISINELIPTALKYDPHNKVVSLGVVIGMVVISASLLMFTI